MGPAVPGDRRQLQVGQQQGRFLGATAGAIGGALGCQWNEPPPPRATHRPPACRRRYAAPPAHQQALLNVLLRCRVGGGASQQEDAAAAEWAQQLVQASRPGSPAPGPPPPPPWPGESAGQQPQHASPRLVQLNPAADVQPALTEASPPAGAAPCSWGEQAPSFVSLPAAPHQDAQQAQQLHQAVQAWQQASAAAAAAEEQAAWGQQGEPFAPAPVEDAILSPPRPASADRSVASVTVRVAVPPPMARGQPRPQQPPPSPPLAAAACGFSTPAARSPPASQQAYPAPEPLPWAPWLPLFASAPGSARSKYPPVYTADLAAHLAQTPGKQATWSACRQQQAPFRQILRALLPFSPSLAPCSCHGRPVSRRLAAEPAHPGRPHRQRPRSGARRRLHRSAAASHPG